jgi:hypothetical protein
MISLVLPLTALGLMLQPPAPWRTARSFPAERVAHMHGRIGRLDCRPQRPNPNPITLTLTKPLLQPGLSRFAVGKLE